jgi:cyclopropane-fatty-acyl-phospholipid synthase
MPTRSLESSPTATETRIEEPAARSAAVALAPLVHAVLGEDLPVEVRFWDGSRLGPLGAPASIVLRTPLAVRRILYCPNEVGFARAFVIGEADIEGDALAALRAIVEQAPDELRIGVRTLSKALWAGIRLGVAGWPLPRPAEEARLRGGRHSKRRDAAAIAHHYDVGNDFYRLLLGESMTYSCARFSDPDDSLEMAQSAKYDLICRKLGLKPGMRLLDVGCGWGGMVMRASDRYGTNSVGVTLSTRQQEWAAKAIAEAGLSARAQARVQDYRDVRDGPYDAISSIGMFEHVGLSRLREYFGHLYQLVKPGGRLLNHGISRQPPSPSGHWLRWPTALPKPDLRLRSGIDRSSFLDRYVFPDGELHEVGKVVSVMQEAGFEVRHVENLREHYALTLRAWVHNLEDHWDAAVDAVGSGRARAWRLFMAASALNFETGRNSIHQVLAVRPTGGQSGLPLRPPF